MYPDDELLVSNLVGRNCVIPDAVLTERLPNCVAALARLTLVTANTPPTIFSCSANVENSTEVFAIRIVTGN